jgi:hypothetical protein
MNTTNAAYIASPSRKTNKVSQRRDFPPFFLISRDYVHLFIGRFAQWAALKAHRQHLCVQIAAVQCARRCLRWMIEQQWPIDVGDLRRGKTPLFRAVMHGKNACVEMLVDAGADVNHINFAQKSILQAFEDKRYRSSFQIGFTVSRFAYLQKYLCDKGARL